MSKEGADPSTGVAGPKPTGESPGSAGTATQDPKRYTQEEVDAKLRGQGKELERLRAIEAELEAAKKAREEADRKTAEERGNYAKLYEEERASRLGLEETVSKLRTRLEEHDRDIAAQVAARLASISSEAVRSQVAALIDGREPRDQERILSLVLSAQSTEPPPPPQGGAPGGNAGGSPPDDARFVSDSGYRVALVQAELDRVREDR